MSTKNGFISLLIAMTSVSFAPILVRLSGSPAQVIAFYRLTFASSITLVILTSLTKVQPDQYSFEMFKKMDRNTFLKLLASSFFLAIHFFSWMLSVQLTTIALSTLFVDTSPIFVTILAYLLLKEKINLKQLVGITSTLIGVILLLAPGVNVITEKDLLGILLAILGAITGAFYIIIGRQARSKMGLGLWDYTLIVYALCAVWLLIFNVPDINQVVLGLTIYELIIFLLLAIFGSILGHSMYNYALKYIKSSTVSICFLGEVIGATLLAMLLFNEIPSLNVVIGGFIVLIGIGLTIFYEK
ncbi:MAG: DMT family transporter [Candidatus Hodarchaeales archaeon]|jgi:drug/metabolite transporter (DMT)-like permease